MTGRFSCTEQVDVIVLGSVWYVGHQLTDQRVARALSSAGRTVAYVDPARNVMVTARAQTQGSSQRLGLTRADDGTFVLTPAILPRGRRAPLATLSNVLLAVQILFMLRGRLASNSVVLAFTGNPVLLTALRRFRRVVVVKDDYLAGASLIALRVAPLARRRRALLNRADAVITVSNALRGDLLTHGVSAMVIPAGTDVPESRAAEPAELLEMPRPRALFSGMVSDRIDLSRLESVVRAGWELIIVGGLQPTFSGSAAFDALVAHEHVHHLGWRPAAFVVAVAQWCDVGLLPYTLTPFNIVSFPLKTLEYLAAGLSVISTRLPAVEELDCSDITLTDTSADFLAALDSVRRANFGAADRKRRVEFATRHSWAVRAQQYLAVMEDR